MMLEKVQFRIAHESEHFRDFLPFSLCFGCYKSLSSRGGNRETTKILVDLNITKKYSFSDKFEEMR